LVLTILVSCTKSVQNCQRETLFPAKNSAFRSTRRSTLKLKFNCSQCGKALPDDRITLGVCGYKPVGYTYSFRIKFFNQFIVWASSLSKVKRAIYRVIERHSTKDVFANGALHRTYKGANLLFKDDSLVSVCN
jgi:hypothetical protein